MVTWQEAHRIAHMAAAKAHSRLRVDVGGTQVDVVGAIGAAGVTLMWRPMPAIFGAYINEIDAAPGILINNGLPHGACRYTAAHELGHHWLAHTTSVDDGSTIDTVAREEFDAIPAANRQRPWPDQEKVAEAFAAWFLMPRRTVAAALAILDLTRPRTPLDVYRLSLLLGTSYRSTLRHLPNLKLAHHQNATTWANVAPGRLKGKIDSGASTPASRRPDVWLLDHGFSSTTVALQPGDRVVLPGVGPGQVQVPDWLTAVGTARPDGHLPGITYEYVPTALPLDAPDRIRVTTRSGTAWAVTVTSIGPQLGLDPRVVQP